MFDAGAGAAALDAGCCGMCWVWLVDDEEPDEFEEPDDDPDWELDDCDADVDEVSGMGGRLRRSSGMSGGATGG